MQLVNMVSLQTILNRLGNKPWLLFDQLLVSGSHFLISVVLARVLGAEIFGWFALGWMILLFVSSIHQAFITIPFMSLYPKLTDTSKSQNPKSEKYIHGVKGIQFICSFLFLAISVLVAGFCYGYNFIALPLNYGLLFIGVIMIYLQYDFIRKNLFTLQKIKSVVGLDVLAYGLQLLAFVYVWYTNQLNLSIALWIILSSYSIASIAFGRHLIFRIAINNFLQTCKKHWQFGKWLIGKSIIQWFTGNYFILSAGVIIGPVALGLVKMAQNIIGLMNVLFIIFENILPVRAAHIYKAKNKAGLIQYLNKFSIKILPVVALCLLLVAVFVKQIALLLYSEASNELILLVRGYAILYVLVFLLIPLTVYIKTIEKTQILFWAYVAGLLFSFVSANFLIQHFAYYGVLIGLIANQIIMIGTYLIGVNFSNKKFIWLKPLQLYKHNKTI